MDRIRAFSEDETAESDRIFLHRSIRFMLFTANEFSAESVTSTLSVTFAETTIYKVFVSSAKYVSKSALFPFTLTDGFASAEKARNPISHFLFSGIREKSPSAGSIARVDDVSFQSKIISVLQQPPFS